MGDVQITERAIAVLKTDARLLFVTRCTRLFAYGGLLVLFVHGSRSVVAHADVTNMYSAAGYRGILLRQSKLLICSSRNGTIHFVSHW